MQEDLDGRTSYSIVRNVESFDSKGGLNLWPNPASASVNILMNAADRNEPVKAQVFDVAGRKFMEKELNNNSRQLNISQLPTGTYLLRVTDNKGVAFNKQFVKQ